MTNSERLVIAFVIAVSEALGTFAIGLVIGMLSFALFPFEWPLSGLGTFGYEHCYSYENIGGNRYGKRASIHTNIRSRSY